MHISHRRLWTGVLLFCTVALIGFIIMPGNSIIFRFARRTLVITNRGELLIHAIVFGILAALCYLILRMSLSHHLALGLALIIASVLGVGTELIHLVVPGRTGSLSDLTADVIGILVVMIGIEWFRRHFPPLARYKPKQIH
jgi:VanZ family protein